MKLDGRLVAASYRNELKSEIENIQNTKGIQPCLAVILVGDDPASQVYVGGKIKACQEVGILSMEFRFPVGVEKEKLQKKITELNEDPNVHGILVQLPLPHHLDESEVISWISPKKDVDGLTSENMGLFWRGQPRVVACTPLGVMKILEYYDLNVSGMKAVVVGRSNIVGKPMALLLQNAGATVSVCHSKTEDLKFYTQNADIVVAALGRPQFLKKEHFNKNALVVDVGMHRVISTGKLCGDVDPEGLEGWIKAITPVPGGVGPMTITMLLHNTLRLATLF
ncbi:MAG: bifunctional methylenetetrahydrofolate dehydrogenase/methenyltetrahydrofolate cyclohydrolase FolD [Bdellovibrionales bacterium]|nr:bifunctional methylenetetrahydrofolate dehydrogenase/methenyltetrahydrofolate cyclohydrolase FolD [Bdellovibrionales bacterium]MCB0413982.1 bifunctional methylenetetrahydrofolate dehydrogenase/methenyltetrahydrofolate cyclohydrolase FolD [Bdellovibrionales bacterium]